MDNKFLKLWWSYKRHYEEDFWICIAYDVEDLRHKYEKEHNEIITPEEFEENYEWSEIDEVDGYKIKLEK